MLLGRDPPLRVPRGCTEPEVTALGGTAPERGVASCGLWAEPGHRPARCGPWANGGVYVLKRLNRDVEEDAVGTVGYDVRL